MYLCQRRFVEWSEIRMSEVSIVFIAGCTGFLLVKSLKNKDYIGCVAAIFAGITCMIFNALFIANI